MTKNYSQGYLPSPAQEKAFTEVKFWTQDDARIVFDEIDADRVGYLTKEQLLEALNRMQFGTSEADVHLLMKLMEDDSEHIEVEKVVNHIHLTQFERFVLRRQEELKKAFCEIDVNKNGYIEVEDVINGLQKLGMVADAYTAGKLLKALDFDKSGKVDFNEFRRVTFLYPSLRVDAIFERWQYAMMDMGETSYNLPTQIPMSVFYKILLAGGFAGAISRTATAPFDRLKILLQAQGGSVNQEYRITGIASGLQEIFKKEGWKGFFRGNGANVVKIFPESASRFFAFEFFKHIVAQDIRDIKPVERFFAGAMAGIVSQTLIYPLEIAKTRLAVSPRGEYSGIMHCLRKTAGTQGSATLYRGLTPALVGIIPYAGVDLAVYSTLKDHWRKRHSGESPSSLVLLGCGAFSSLCGQVIAYPLQLVRTRLQAQGTPGRPILYQGMFDCIKQVVEADGVSGLYRGILPNFLKAIPSVSISYVCYENAKRLMGIDLET